MITIKTKVKIIADEYNYGGIEEYPGINIENNTEYRISTELQTLLNELDDNEHIYIWDRETLNSQGLNIIELEGNEFFVVYYGNEEHDCEVYFSEGFNDKYNLTEIQSLEI